MISLELMDEVWAPPGQMFVERLGAPERRGLIYLAHTSRETARTAEGQVMQSSLPEFEAGEKVLLGPAATIAVTFGSVPNERVWYLVSRGDVLARVRVDAEDRVKVGDRHTLSGYDSRQLDRHEGDDLFPEGDPAGLL